MKCCNQSKNNKHLGHSHSIWMMILCCGVPILLFFVISMLGANFTALKAVLISILPFLCPAMMLLMIPMMFMKSKGRGESHENLANKLTEAEKDRNGT